MTGSRSYTFMLAIAAASACVSAPWVVDSRKTRGFVGLIEPAELHVLSLARERGHREAVGERLAEARKVGRDAVVFLRAAVVPAEASDHLVDNEQGPVRIAKCLQVSRDILRWGPRGGPPPG